jgi:hypothetical protein
MSVFRMARLHDAAETGDGQHPPRRQRTGEGEGGQHGPQRRVDRAHRAEHRPPAEAVAQHPEQRRDQRPHVLERAEHREEQHRARLGHDVPAEDHGLHLERPGRQEIGEPLEAEAPDAEGGEDHAVEKVGEGRGPVSRAWFLTSPPR